MCSVEVKSFLLYVPTSLYIANVHHAYTEENMKENKNKSQTLAQKNFHAIHLS